MLRPAFERFAVRLERNPRAVLALLIGLVLLIGVVYSIRLGSELRYPDEHQYWEIAGNLVTEHRFHAGADVAFRPPGYPVLLTIPRAVGSIFLARMMNFAFLAGAMFLLERIVTSYTRPAAGLLAAAWVFAYPILIYATSTLYPQIMVGCLLLLFFKLLLEPRPRFFWAGLVFGVLVLTVPSFGPLIVFVPLWLWFNDKRLSPASLAALFGACALPIAVWTLRNTLALHEVVPISTNSGLNLLLGNCEHATSSSGVNVDISSYERAAESMSETARDAFYKKSALAWISSNPGQALGLYIGKLIHYFSMNDQIATASEGGTLRKVFAIVIFLPLQAALLVRLLLMKRFPLHRAEQLLVGFFLLNAPLAAAFFTRVRLRLPVDFCLLALGAGLLALLVRPAQAADQPS